MSSESSTERRGVGRGDTGLQPWHFYLLLSMAGATGAVLVSPHTHPAALAFLSAAIIAAGLAAATLHQALVGFFGLQSDRQSPLPEHVRASLENDKALVLRSIKELEFDRAMGKVSESDFDEISGRLRARALALIEELDHAGDAPAAPHAASPAPHREAVCGHCRTMNDPDARFCKGCGARLT